MSNKKIFIVEDEGIVAMDIANALEDFGYTVTDIASSGDEAIQKMKGSLSDLVLMDVRIKGVMDGIEVARHIQTNYNIPIIYLTAYADNDTIERAIPTTPYGYIVKPFEAKEIHANIQMALNKHSMEQKLKENERLFDEILKTLGWGTITIDKEQQIKEMDSVAAQLTGCTNNEYRGKNLTEMIQIADLRTCEKLDALKANRIQTNMSFQNLSLIVQKQKEIQADLYITPVFDREGNVSESILRFRDVSKEKQIKERLKHSFLKVQQTIDSIINGLLAITEAHDDFLTVHQRCVAQLAYAIAQDMNLPAWHQESVHTAALFHDIGKIAIPSEFLNKIWLDDNEFKYIKTHPKTGYEILKKIDFPPLVANIVLQHHERIDGSGYPEGLINEEILLEARIVAVADVIEAMTSPRPYRLAFFIEDALQEIEENKGSLYDPAVAESCLNLFRNKGFTFKYPPKFLKDEK